MNRIDFQRFNRMVLITIIAVGVVTCVAMPKGFSQEPRYQLDKDTAFDVFLKKHAWLE